MGAVLRVYLRVTRTVSSYRGVSIFHRQVSGYDHETSGTILHCTPTSYVSAIAGYPVGVTFMGTPRVPQMNNRDIPRATRFRPEIPPYSGMHDTSIP